jgi:hypothetical protein
MRIRSLVVVALLIMVAVPAGAQMPQNFEKGFAPEKIYQFGNLDNVNLFNGNLTVIIPIGDTYGLDGGTAYGLVLSYNSSVWEHWDVTPIPVGGGSWSCCVQWTFPNRRSNAGLGWTLSLGRLVAANSPLSALNIVGTGAYESPDGNDHLIGGGLSTNTVRTIDGTLMRWHTDTQKLDSPDGLQRSFYTDSALAQLKRTDGSSESTITSAIS